MQDTPEKWRQFRTTLSTSWATTYPQLQAIKLDVSLPRSTRINDIGSLIHQCYHRTAHSTFGVSEQNKIWKKWITKKQQAISIRYHRFYRRFRHQSRHTADDWRTLKTLRSERNNSMRHHKTSYLNHKFSKYGLNGRKGWQTASEVRNLNETKGHTLPDLTTPRGDVIATTNQERCDVFNDYQHRWNAHQLTAPSWCWQPAQVISPPPYVPAAIQMARIEQKDGDPMPHSISTIPAFDTSNDEYIVDDYDDLHLRFSNWITRITHNKWRRARRNHTYYIHLLNSAITPQEIRRALRGFNNYRAQGPDEIDIKFLKKPGPISVTILEYYLNTIFTDWQLVPNLIKSRWIVPVLKPGRPANLLKNLRPVSLTSYFGKLFEKIMNYRLVTYLVRLNLLSCKQFAYLPGRSPKDCVSFVMDRIMRNFQRKIPTHTVFFDLSSAFDTVQHDLLLWKLQHEYFINGPFLDTLKSFLTQRQSAVKICGLLSPWQTDIRGCPQGGGLSAILYLIYFDNASAVECIARIKILIYSDDVLLYNDDHTASCTAMHKQQLALQLAILFIQWYTEYHGLRINQEKTYYKIFHRRRHLPANDDIGPSRYGLGFNDVNIDLHFSGMITHRIRALQHIPPDVPLKCKTTPVKYLGVWLDTPLRFKHHSTMLLRRLHATFYSMHRNLKHLHHVKASIIWTIIDMCLLSVYDYSSMLWPHLLKRDQSKWIVLYHMIVRSSLRVPKSTRLTFLFAQLHTYDLDTRLRMINSQHFNRFLRGPRSSTLHNLLRNVYWPYIKFECNRHNAWLKREEHHANTIRYYVRRPVPPLSTAQCRRFIDIKSTIFRSMIDEAIRTRNDDATYITSSTNIDSIPCQISYSLDLTRAWATVPFIATPFTDDLPRPMLNELYVFTDGAVKGRCGGYGYHFIQSDHYHSLLPRLPIKDTDPILQAQKHLLPPQSPHPPPRTQRHQSLRLQLYKLHCDALPPNPLLVPRDHHQTLSSRTSIDFCEALAVNDAVLHLARSIETNLPDPTALHAMNIHAIRIIADSLVSIHWLTGIYRIKNPRMKEIINASHWNIATIRDTHHAIPITISWTKAHAHTLGNDYADWLAYKARATIGHRDPYFPIWKWYNIRAVLNQSTDFYKAKMATDIRKAITVSTYAVPMSRHRAAQQRDTPYRIKYAWQRCWKQELDTHSRSSMRILVMLRTGHSYLKHYLFHRLHIGANDHCICNLPGQDIYHLLRNCPYPSIANHRLYIIREARRLCRDYNAQLDDDSKALHPTDDQLHDPNFYLYPKHILPISTRSDLQHLIINLYRTARGYTASHRGR